VTLAEFSQRFRIPLELLELAGVRHVTDGEVRELLGVHGRAGQDLGGIVFPYRDPRDGHGRGHRVRLDTQLGDRQKYFSEQGCRALFFPPMQCDALTDVSVPIVMVESEKAALALTALAARHVRKMLAVGIGGVYGLKRRIGVESGPNGQRTPVTGPSPSLDSIVLQSRRAIIAFDSNVAGSRDLEKARLMLASELRKRGSQVFIASTPKRGGANGPDDVIALLGDEEALQMLDRAAPFAPGNVSRSMATGFVLTRLGDLLNKPDTPTDYVLEGILVVGGVSGIVAKPKVGKSTFARSLCLAVARGEEFLGLSTKQGECIYLALEEREEDIRNDFQAMGADGTEPIYVHAASAPAEGITALSDLLRERKPVLLVIDPLFRLARIRDEKAYAETYAALGPLIDIAREVGTHVTFCHHAGKGHKADSVDSPLGSTAIGGVVSTLIVLRRTREQRTIETIQRTGKDLCETVVELDSDTRRLVLSGTRLEAESRKCEIEILEFLKVASEPQTQQQIRDGVEGQTRLIRAALTALVDAASVERTGDGKKGRPFLYAFPNSGSEDIVGTRKPESQHPRKVAEMKEHPLVPEGPHTSMVVPETDESGDTVRV